MKDRYKVAHDLLFANYVCPSGKHYPLEFRVFKKRERCEGEGEKFHDHGVLFRELIAWVVAHNIPGDFTFDSYFSKVWENLNFIHSQPDHSGPTPGLRGGSEDQSKNRVSQSRDPGGRVGGIHRLVLSEGNSARGHAAMVLHLHRPHSGCAPQGADPDPVASSPGSPAVQDSRFESDPVGSPADLEGVPTSVDRHGDIPSGRQTGIGDG